MSRSRMETLPELTVLGRSCFLKLAVCLLTTADTWHKKAAASLSHLAQ